MDKSLSKNISLAIKCYHHSLCIGANEEEAALLTQSLLSDSQEEYEKKVAEISLKIKTRINEETRQSILKQRHYEVQEKIKFLHEMGCKGTITYNGEKFKV